MKTSAYAGLACAALVLGGCATAPTRQPAAPATTSTPATPEPSLSYHVFMGELAWQRGERRIAVQQYAQAAELGRDPQLAEHAALMAYHVNDDALALKLVRRWRLLTPNSTDARQLEAVLGTRLGDVDDAVRDFETLLQVVPGYNFLLIGEVLEDEAGAQRSLPVMQKLVAVHAQSAEAHFALAQLALRAQQAELAVGESQRAAALRPAWNQAAVLQAQALVAAGRKTEAVQLLQARVRRAPADPDLHLAYAGLLAEVGQDGAAAEEFNAVLKQHARNPDALYALGLLALQANQLEQAHGYFMRLLVTGQRNNDAFYFLGNTAEAAKQFGPALQWYQQVDSGKFWLPAQVATVRVLLQQHQAADARAYMDKLVAADPDDGVQIRLAEAQLFSDMGDHQTALAVLQQALVENPGNNNVLYSRALLHENLGQVAQAEADLRLILDRQPDNADALNALGYTLAVYSTRFQEARIYIAKALHLKPGDPAIMDSMGWVEYRLGNYPQALGYLRQAYAQLADPEVAAHLSETLWAAGDRQEARSVWGLALKQHPDNAALLKLRPRFTP